MGNLHYTHTPMSTQFTYDGPLITREEFLRGAPGVYRVEGEPITGQKQVNCTNFFRNGMIWSTRLCMVDVEVPAGEYVVTSPKQGFTSLRNSRATGINISTEDATMITSAFRPPYLYRTGKLNTPGKFHGKCTEDWFFEVNSQAECGMHFTFKRAE